MSRNGCWGGASRRTMWPGLACLALVICAASAGCARGPQYYLNKGNSLYFQGVYPEAALNYRKGIQKEPDSAELYFRLGLTELKLNDASGAYHDLRRSCDLAPEREDVRVQLADLALLSYSSDPRKPKALYDEVVSAATLLLRKNPASFDGLRFHGDVLAIDGKLEESAAVFEKANAIKPLEPSLILPLAQVLFLLNRTTEAQKLAEECIRTHKNAEPIYQVLYNQYISTGQLTEAETVLNSEIANIPNDPGPILQLARFFFDHNREPDTSRVLQRILSNSKEFPKGHRIVGDFYQSTQKWSDAVREYLAAIQSDSKTADKQSDRKRTANVLTVMGKPDEAIEQFNQILKVDANDSEARLARAILLRESNDSKKRELAITELNLILKTSPNDLVARYNLGLAYLTKGDVRSARTELTQSAGLNKSYLQPRLTLVELALQEKAYSEAVRFSEEILAVDPANANARLWHAAGLIGNKEYGMARSDLNTLARQYPDSTDVKLHLALLDADEKQYREAEALYLTIYRPGQKDIRPLEGLVELYGREQQTEKGRKLLEDELKRAPDSSPVRLLMATADVRVGKLDDAIQQYEWLSANDPRSPQTYESLGDVYILKGDLKNSLASYQRAREMAPDDPGVIGRIAYLESTSSQYKEAIANLQRQLVLNPEDMIAMNNLAFALAETGTDLDKALALAEKARRKAPDNAGVADTLGWVYTRKGLNDSAVQIFSSLIKQHPDAPAFRYHLGVALLQQGKRAEAKAQLELGLAEKPPKDLAEKIEDLVAKIG